MGKDRGKSREGEGKDLSVIGKAKNTSFSRDHQGMGAKELEYLCRCYVASRVKNLVILSLYSLGCSQNPALFTVAMHEEQQVV